jgi:hypothetical protein
VDRRDAAASQGKNGQKRRDPTRHGIKRAALFRRRQNKAMGHGYPRHGSILFKHGPFVRHL